MIEQASSVHRNGSGPFTVRLIAAAAAVGAILAVGAAAARAGQVEQSSGSANPFYGSFTQEDDLVVPPFHGIEPSLGLRYNSSSGDGFVGVGYSLGGISVIERGSPGKGAPNYNSTDIFMLDGQELVASTSMGGTHANKVQDYVRIQKDVPATNQWTVTQKDGTKAIFSSVHTTTLGTFRWGLTQVIDTKNNTVTYNWACDSSYDCYPSTITYNNVVITFYKELAPSYGYFANGVTVGQTRYRLKTVAVKVASSPLRAYALGYTKSTATGRSMLTSLKQYGKDAIVDSAGNVTGGSCVDVPTGCDPTCVGGQICTYDIYLGEICEPCSTGCTQQCTGVPVSLPAITNTRTTSTTSLTSPVVSKSRAYNTAGDHVADFNGDGRDDLLIWHYRTTSTADAPVGTNRYVLYLANASGGYNAPITTIARSNDLSSDKIGDFNGDGKADLLVWHYKNYTTTDAPIGNYRYNLYLSNGNGFSAPITTIARSNSTTADKVGDFNGDGKADLLVWHYKNLTTTDSPIGTYRYNLYLSTGSGLASPIVTNARSYSTTADKLGDFDGDGKTDLLVWHYRTIGTADSPVGTNRYVLYPSTGSGFSTPVTTIARSNNTSGDHVGDFNGDGKADLLIWHYRNYSTTDAPVGNYRYNLYASNGLGLSSPVATNARAYDLNGDHVADFNGDGRADLLVWHYKTLTTTDSPTANYRYNLYTSTGNGFGTPVTTIARSNNLSSDHVGDFNGDGKSDFFVWHYKNYTTTDAPVGNYRYNVYRSGGAPVDLMATRNASTGATTTISYTPSSTWVNTNNPPIMQTVTAVSTGDGRGNTSTLGYSYNGGLQDWQGRRFLGFHYSKEVQPCITGETQCPYKETWWNQNYGSVSKPETEETRTGAGNLITRTTHTYTTNGATVPYTSLEVSSWNYTYDGTGAACGSWPCAVGRRTYATLAYDAYANVTAQTGWGNYDLAGDEQTISQTFVYNTSKYIVAALASTKKYQGTSASGTPIEDHQIYYDNATTWNQAPSTGLPTQRRQYHSESGSWVVTKAEFDAWGNTTAIVDALNNRKTIAYDSTHIYEVSTTNALSQTVTSVIDPVCGVPTTVTDRSGRVATTTLDVYCRATRIDTPLSGFQIFSFVNAGNATTQYQQTQSPGADGSANSWARSYKDGLGREYKVVTKGPSTSQDIIVERTFNARGQVSGETLPYYTGQTPRWATHAYDSLDRPTRVTFPDGTYQTMSYPSPGTKRAVDVLGAITEEEVNSYGQVTARREWLGSSLRQTSYAYDGRGQLTSQTDPAGNVTSYLYDSLGRRTRIIDPDTGTTTHEWDANDRLVRTVDGRGKAVTYTYDAIGRKKTQTYVNAAGANVTTTWTYDQARSGYKNVGMLTSMTDSEGSATWDYDGAGRLAHGTRVIGGVSYATTKGYDSGGRLKWTTYPDLDTLGTASSPLVYDAAGRLKSIPGLVTSAVYDAAGNVTTLTNVNGTVTTVNRSATRGWVSSIATVKGSTTIQNLSYTRNSGGLITAITSPFTGESWTYSYDGLRQLLSATNTSSSTNNQTWTYDTVGNIKTNSRIGTYAYPGAGASRPHAVSSAGANSYAYDGAGNMTSGAGRSYSWDGLGRPVTISGATYGYAGDGGRVRKVVSGVTTHYLGDDYEVVGGVATKYVSLGGTLVAKRVGTTNYWLHADAQGSIKAVTNSTGTTVVQRLSYRPSGERLSTSSSHVESRSYTGQRQDETGLFYLHARYYDPQLGRFISADPSVPSDAAIGLNRYAYAANDPINNTDTDGLGFFKKLFKGLKRLAKGLLALPKLSIKFANSVIQAIRKVAQKYVMAFIAIVVLVFALWLGPLIITAAMSMTGAMTAGGMCYATVMAAATSTVLGAVTFVAASAAVGFLTSFTIAYGLGAPTSVALKAGWTGAKVGAISAIFNLFSYSVLGFDKNVIGEKATTEGKSVDTLLGRLQKRLGFSDKPLLPEGGAISEATSMGASGGLARPYAYIHDGFMKSIGAYETVDGLLYAKQYSSLLVNTLIHDVANYASLFSIEIAVQKASTILGEKLNAKLGYSQTGALLQTTFSQPLGIWTTAEGIYNQGKAAGG